MTLENEAISFVYTWHCCATFFPVRESDKFVKAGIDINKYGAWWETGSHLKNANQYNEAWRTFFRPGFNPTQYQIWQEAFRLKGIYGY
jgi:hypothetical protein